jgi:hypothetical protein
MFTKKPSKGPFTLSSLRGKPLALAVVCAAALSNAGATVTITNGSPASIEFAFDTVLDGKPEPGGVAPWVTVTFTDTAVPNRVTALFEVSEAGLATGEFLTKFFFNYDAALVGGTFALSPTVIKPDAYDAKVNNFDYTTPKGAGGGFSFDLLIAYATANNDGRLTKGESVEFDITYSNPANPGVTFDALDLFDLSSHKNGTLGPYAEAHVQGLAGGKSTWITPGVEVTENPNPVLNPIPEPGSTAALMGLLSCGLFLRSRRTRSA